MLCLGIEEMAVRPPVQRIPQRRREDIPGQGGRAHQSTGMISFTLNYLLLLCHGAFIFFARLWPSYKKITPDSNETIFYLSLFYIDEKTLIAFTF